MIWLAIFLIVLLTTSGITEWLFIVTLKLLLSSWLILIIIFSLGLSNSWM